MSYAVVQDVPASWEHYEALRGAIDAHAPEGLVLHVAGPTDEGFRTIEVWASREDWVRFAAIRAAAVAGDSVLAAAEPSTLRELRALATIAGRGAPA